MFTKTGMLFDKGEGNLEAFLSSISLNYASDVSEVSMYSENKTRILPLTFLILQDTSFRKTNTFAIRTRLLHSIEEDVSVVKVNEQNMNAFNVTKCKNVTPF